MGYERVCIIYSCMYVHWYKWVGGMRKIEKLLTNVQSFVVK